MTLQIIPFECTVKFLSFLPKLFFKKIARIPNYAVVTNFPDLWFFVKMRMLVCLHKKSLSGKEIDRQINLRVRWVQNITLFLLEFLRC